MSKLIGEHLKRIGVDVILGSITRDIRRVNGSLEVTLMNGRSLHPDAVLFAAGRSVNTNGLGLKEAGGSSLYRGKCKRLNQDCNALESIVISFKLQIPLLHEVERLLQIKR